MRTLELRCDVEGNQSSGVTVRVQNVEAQLLRVALTPEERMTRLRTAIRAALPVSLYGDSRVEIFGSDLIVSGVHTSPEIAIRHVAIGLGAVLSGFICLTKSQIS